MIKLFVLHSFTEVVKDSPSIGQTAQNHFYSSSQTQLQTFKDYNQAEQDMLMPSCDVHARCLIDF